MRLANLLLALATLGCNPSSSSVATATMATPTAQTGVIDPTPSAQTTPSPSSLSPATWPAGFEEQVCIAIKADADVIGEFRAMREAAGRGDAGEASRHAYAASAAADTIGTALSQAPEWAPAADFIAPWREAAASLKSGFEKTGEVLALTSGSGGTLLGEGTREITNGMASLDLAVTEYVAFQRATGFACSTPPAS